MTQSIAAHAQSLCTVMPDKNRATARSGHLGARPDVVWQPPV
eukprot:CAMPEP_0203949596 /NCGR_PEP_ID=MMETSP0359-20131031/83967_1 /ASSEMBLY_ACC=CAM_ASM_000338 /TAXON_ID=268821 /ORGANISM="Scrippsiella Hangoei, Strain SHTV-5" /LENGTH=41 /DNA_ID= /DNA_START= /DNA_END= /DNA_ORIENTATION=